MMNYFNRLVTGTTLLTALILTSFSAAATTRWDMATPYPDATYHTKNIRQFAAEVKSLTQGNFDIRVHSGSSLIKHPEIPRVVRSGQIPIGEVFIGIMGNSDPIYKLDNLPFLATNFAQAKKLYQVSKPLLEKKLNQEGMMLLYAVPWPPQGIYSKKPVHSIADMKGVRMRSYSPTLSRLATLIGAQPTTIQNVDIPQAFSTGIIDMMITSSSTGVNSQAWDYVSNYTDVQAWIPKDMVIINTRAFKRLDKPMQSALLEAAKHAETRGWKLAKEETVNQTKQLQAHGMNVVKPSPELTAALKKIGIQMAKEWEKTAGPDGAKLLKAYQN